MGEGGVCSGQGRGGLVRVVWSVVKVVVACNLPVAVLRPAMLKPATEHANGWPWVTMHVSSRSGKSQKDGGRARESCWRLWQ